MQDHLLSSNACGVSSKASKSGPGRLKCGETEESLRLSGVQGTCCFPPIDAIHDETECLNCGLTLIRLLPGLVHPENENCWTCDFLSWPTFSFPAADVEVFFKNSL